MEGAREADLYVKRHHVTNTGIKGRIIISMAKRHKYPHVYVPQ